MSGIEFFSSPIGLGHVTRDIAIAGNLQTPPRFVTGGGAAQLLRMGGWQVRDVYRPPQFAVRDGSLQSTARWLWKYYRYYRDCKGISERILGPGTELVTSDEDFASLAVAQKMGVPTVLITDILETHFTKGPVSLVEKRMNKSMHDIMAKCDAVIVPEQGEDEGNVRRVGPIVRNTTHSRDELRKRFGFCRDTVVISAGGTDAGLYMIQKAVDAVSKMHDTDAVLVSGPQIGKKFEGVRNMGFVENLHEIIFAADAIVSLAGRSTIDEANAYGTPGIFIPIRGHFEQEANAEREGFAFDDVHMLDEMITSKLGERRGAISAGGAKRAADIIEQLKD